MASGQLHPELPCVPGEAHRPSAVLNELPEQLDVRYNRREELCVRAEI